MDESARNTDAGTPQPETPRAPGQFSLFDPAVSSDPFEFYASVQATCPVYRIPERGFYLISRYRDLEGVLRDHATFSNEMERAEWVQGENAHIIIDVLREKGWDHVPTLQRTDPPLHTRYRKIIDAALNMRQIRTLEPHLVELAHRLIDRFIDRGTCDFIDEFSLPFTGIVIAELIGLDAQDYRKFKRWADNLISYGVRIMNPDELRAAAEIEVEMQQFVARVIADRKQNPRDDLVTGLIAAYDGVEPLSMHELQNVMHQLIAGGYETTMSAINHGLWQMIRFPEATAELRADRSLMRAFIDESLRWESPLQGLFRIATREVECAGTVIPKGAMCNVRFGAANRDPAEFPEPATFDIHRENANQHLAFGAPPHFCPGAFLARSEMAVAFNAILDRMDDFRLASPLPCPVHEPSVGFLPMKELRLGFRKRSA